MLVSCKACRSDHGIALADEVVPAHTSLQSGGAMVQACCSSTGPEWAELPDDALKYIFSQLQPASLRGIRLVCSAWLRTVGRFIVTLQPESFTGTGFQPFVALGWELLLLCAGIV